MKNKELGLPYSEDGMEKVAFCFDVDGTLIDENWPLSTTQSLLTAMLLQKWKNVDIIVWSGGGANYAETHFRRWFPDLVGAKFHSKLEHTELRKKYTHLIAVDDIQDTRLGDVNLIVRNK
jgi:hydroxymethylpyrimidine pyrophosphatase-like HAD family hydrolase